MEADGQSFQAAIQAGLKLSAYGEQVVAASESEEKTREETEDKYSENHFWNHDKTTKAGHEFDYKKAAETPTTTTESSSTTSATRE
jgi:hypothetical protein